MQEDIGRMYTPQEQPNAEETREDRGTGEWQDHAEQQGDTSHLFENPPCLRSAQGNQEPQPMDDIEELVTDYGEGEGVSLAPSIISSSFYSDEVLPEERLFEERVPFEDTPHRAIVSAPMEAEKRTNPPKNGSNSSFTMGTTGLRWKNTSLVLLFALRWSSRQKNTQVREDIYSTPLFGHCSPQNALKPL